MNPLSFLNPFNKVMGIIEKAVPDKDMQIKLNAELAKMKDQIYLKALETPTIPWVDALHKMGRQLNGYVSILAIVVLKLADIDLSMEEAAALASSSTAYAVVKGRGRS